MLHDALRGLNQRRACDIGVRKVTPGDNSERVAAAVMKQKTGQKKDKKREKKLCFKLYSMY
jgi:hypothetical protein